MLQNIVQNSSSFGKLNAVVCFQDTKEKLQLFYEIINERFEPTEVHRSLFDLSTFTMQPLNDLIHAGEGDLIIKAIFEKAEEKMILENYKQSFIVEHLPHLTTYSSERDHELIKGFLNHKLDATLILGFELSIHVDAIDSSISECIHDPSLHPVIIVKSGSQGCTINEYNASSNEINMRKKTILQNYLSLILNS